MYDLKYDKEKVRYYKTVSFDTAVILLSFGNNVMYTEQKDKQVIFCFEDNDSLRQTLQFRMNGQLRIDPEKIFSSERFLRTLIKEKTINY